MALVDGVSIKELAEYLGRKDPGFTLRTYAHMMPGSHERPRRAIDDRLLRPRVPGLTEQGTEDDVLPDDAISERAGR
ncbi:hypothetical protein [Nonomuraea sp. NPDC050786]|uniref:hypothetical protein n=1 Tax=Nonomuraea sp. NPDC050786 TaxID=3154840 RepID=UPI0033C91750